MSKRASTKTRHEAPPTATPKRPAPNGRTAAPARKPPAKRTVRATRARAARATAGRRSFSVTDALRGVPRTAWVCALVAVLNAACWSILIPPLEGPDEQAHFAYTQLIAETGRLPSSPEENYSPEEQTAMRDLGFGETILSPGTASVPTRSEHDQLLHDLSQPLSRKSDGSGGVATSEPPLYYALQTIPYALGAGATILGRMELMRLLSALLGGLTVLFVFFFLREALPAVPWAWTVGTLCAALSPLFGFVGGSIDPDALLFVVCAAMFYCFARAFRRGFSPRLAAVLGVVIATGFLTKVNFVALVPGIAVGLVLLTIRTARANRRLAYRCLALSGGIAAFPVALYALRNVAKHQPALGIVSGSYDIMRAHSLSAEVSYVWQLYFPRLPGMVKDFPGIFPPLQIWFKGVVGRYNWLETVFPHWVYTIALIPAGLILGLCAREIYLRRAVLGSRKSEIAVYLTMVIGLAGLLGGASFGAFPTLAAGDSEPRYFLPLLAFGCAFLALAARGAGRRWGPVAGASIVLLIFTHDVLSQLLEISRYYHPY